MEKTTRNDRDPRLTNVIASLTRDELCAVIDELHEHIIDEKCREANALRSQGIDAQLEYLRDRLKDDVIIDIVLDGVDRAKLLQGH